MFEWQKIEQLFLNEFTGFLFSQLDQNVSGGEKVFEYDLNRSIGMFLAREVYEQFQFKTPDGITDQYPRSLAGIIRSMRNKVSHLNVDTYLSHDQKLQLLIAMRELTAILYTYQKDRTKDESNQFTSSKELMNVLRDAIDEVILEKHKEYKKYHSSIDDIRQILEEMVERVTELADKKQDQYDMLVDAISKSFKNNELVNSDLNNSIVKSFERLENELQKQKKESEKQLAIYNERIEELKDNIEVKTKGIEPVDEEMESFEDYLTWFSTVSEIKWNMCAEFADTKNTFSENEVDLLRNMGKKAKYGNKPVSLAQAQYAYSVYNRVLEAMNKDEAEPEVSSSLLRDLMEQDEDDII